MAFTKIDAGVILDRSEIYEPDYVVVLDSTLLGTVNVTAGLKPGGKVVINWPGAQAEQPSSSDYEYIAIDATQIAQSIIGRPITNTTMVGALSAATGIVSLAAVQKAIAEALPSQLAAKNVAAAAAAFNAISGRKHNAEFATR